MDKFMQSQKTVPLRKKAKVSVADLMRAGAAKKKPFGENDATAMGSLGAKALARIDARIRKEQSALSDDQRSVVDKAKDGGNVFITGNAARPPASVPCRHRPRAPRSADASPRHHVDLPRRRVAATPRLPRGYSVETRRVAAARGYVRGVAAYQWTFRGDESRGDAAAATWIFRGAQTRPRRRYSVGLRRGRVTTWILETSRGDAAAATWIFRGSQTRPRDHVDLPRRRESRRRRGCHVDIP